VQSRIGNSTRRALPAIPFQIVDGGRQDRHDLVCPGRRPACGRRTVEMKGTRLRASATVDGLSVGSGANDPSPSGRQSTLFLLRTRGLDRKKEPAPRHRAGRVRQHMDIGLCVSGRSILPMRSFARFGVAGSPHVRLRPNEADVVRLSWPPKGPRTVWASRMFLISGKGTQKRISIAEHHTRSYRRCSDRAGPAIIRKRPGGLRVTAPRLLRIRTG